MLNISTELHIQDTTKTDKRGLVRGVINEEKSGGFVGSFEEARFTVMADQEIVVFFEQRRKFMQQAGRVIEVQSGQTGLTFAFETIGEAVSAEDREFYRTSAVSAEIDASIGVETSCRMVDVSATGFAYIGKKEHAIGATIDAMVSHEGKEFSGTMSVQSVRDLGILGIRHGVRYLENEADAGTLRNGLQMISLKVEREMLQRKSGNS